MAIERSDVCVIMIDATEGVTEQDTKVAGLAHEAGRACIIAVNKWDAVEKNDKTMQEFRKKLDADFAFMSYAPKVFISAKTGMRIDRLFEYIISCNDSANRRIEQVCSTNFLLRLQQEFNRRRTRVSDLKFSI